MSPHSPWGDHLLAAINPSTQLADGDAIALEQASRDVAERVPRLTVIASSWREGWSIIRQCIGFAAPRTVQTSGT